VNRPEPGPRQVADAPCKTSSLYLACCRPNSLAIAVLLVHVGGCLQARAGPAVARKPAPARARGHTDDRICEEVSVLGVEVRVDNGPWTAAELADQLGVETWRQWRWR